VDMRGEERKKEEREKERKNSMEQSPFWEAKVIQLDKKFPTFYINWRFITVFTRVRHWSRSWARWIQSTSSHPNIHSNIILPSMSRSSEWSLPFRVYDQNFVCISHISHAGYAPQQRKKEGRTALTIAAKGQWVFQGVANIDIPHGLCKQAGFGRERWPRLCPYPLSGFVLSYVWYVLSGRSTWSRVTRRPWQQNLTNRSKHFTLHKLWHNRKSVVK
jgi:hypothetical protein